MKKIGIIADDYKLEMFKKELTDNGFTDFEVKQLATNVSTIFVKIQDNQAKDIAVICKRIELRVRVKFNIN